MTQAASGRITQHQDSKINDDLDRIWRFLQSIQIGPGWRLRVSGDDLYIQKYNATDRKYKSKARLSKDGNLYITGVLSASASIADIGKE